MQGKSWAQPQLGWAFQCVPAVQIPVLLGMSSWLQNTVESPCNSTVRTHVMIVVLYLLVSCSQKRLTRWWGTCCRGKYWIVLWKQIHGLAEFPIYLFLLLLCYYVDPNLEDDLHRPPVPPSFCILPWNTPCSCQSDTLEVIKVPK